MTSPLTLTVLQPNSCEGCGLCCEGNGSPVLLYSTRGDGSVPNRFRPPGLPRELIDEIDARLGGLFRGQEPSDRCIWFDPDQRACQHYEWRPDVCRDYELGGIACLETRRGFLAMTESKPSATDRPCAD